MPLKSVTDISNAQSGDHAFRAALLEPPENP
jgi:hypothetical protein